MNEQRDDVAVGSIVVGLDGSEHAVRALDWAAEQASLEGRTLTLLCAGVEVSAMYEGWIAQAAMSSAELRIELEASSRRLIEDATVRVAEKFPNVEVDSRIISIDPRNALIDASEFASLIVVGSRGRGPLRSSLMGSVSAAIARSSKCPVVVCRPRPENQRHGVVVGADGSEASLPVIEFAFRQASLRRLALTVTHCLWDTQGAIYGVMPRDPQEAELMLSESVAGLGEKYPDVVVTLELATGLVTETFADLSNEADLIVVGRHKYGLLSRIVYGSLSLAVLERSKTTVALVPEADPDEALR